MGSGGALVEIDFTETGNSAPFRREGWSGQEPDRVWAIGPRSVLTVPIQPAGLPLILEAEAGPCHAPPAISGQIMRVSVNDVDLGWARLECLAMVRCEIPPAAVPVDGTLNIAFGFPCFYRPRGIGRSGDDRPLAVWFSSVRIYTAGLFGPGPRPDSGRAGIPVIGLSPRLAEAADGTAGGLDRDRQVYTFGSKGSARPFLGPGWDNTRDDVSVMAAAAAQLGLGSVAAGAILRLDLGQSPDGGPAASRDVTVLLDRMVVGQFALTGPIAWFMALPRELTKRRDRPVLTLLSTQPGEAAPDDSGAQAEPGLPSAPLHEGVAVSRMLIVPAGEDLLRRFESVRESGVPRSMVTDQSDAPGIAALLPPLAGSRAEPACGSSGGGTPEETPRDVANWVLALPLRAPRDLRGVFQLLGQLRPGESLLSLTDRIDFQDVTPDRLFHLIAARHPLDRDRAVVRGTFDAAAAFRLAILSAEFRERCPFAFLEAFPELARNIFIHVPKCAGTDLIMNLGPRQRRMTLPYMLKFPEWIADDAFLTILGGLARAAPFHDEIFVYGHMRLGQMLERCELRPCDKVFSILREPLAMMVSNANYVVGRLRRDPEGRDPDTAETLARLRMPRLPPEISDRDLKDVVVRALLHPEITVSNNACRHFAGGEADGFAEAIAGIVAHDVELTTVPHYERWLEDRWNISGSDHHNRSEPILTCNEARHLLAGASRDRSSEDAELFNFIAWALRKTGASSVSGREIAELSAPRTPAVFWRTAPEAVAGSGLHETRDLFVLHDADRVARYLQPPSVTIPGGQGVEENLSFCFGDDGMGGALLGAGWSKSEREFTWTNGTESTISLPPSDGRGRRFVRLIGLPFIVDERIAAQEIAISVNGVKLGTCTVHDFCLIEFEIPAPIVAARATAEIKLTIPGATSPALFKNIRDRRLLGFCLRQMFTVRYAAQRDEGQRVAARRDGHAADALTPERLPAGA